MSTQPEETGPRMVSPGVTWRWARRFVQSFALLAIFLAPFLGGWQRLDRSNIANWDSEGAELPPDLRAALPLGDAPAAAYDALQLSGGGMAVEYFGVPAADPISGAFAVFVAGANTRTAVAIFLPLLLALIGGRVFCGWLCPFGTISRLLARVREAIPGTQRYVVPERRPVRWLVLAVAVLAGLLGVHLVLYLSLPFLLLQQSVYSAWLLGGGGAIMGVFFGLLAAGLVLAPTAYCTAICPTGAVLGLFGRARLLRVRIESPKSCSSKCDLCDQACWLHLDPASGDPGPDCDLCARCVPACPRTNLRVGVGRGKLKLPVVTAALLLAGGSLLAPSGAAALDDVKPSLVLESEAEVGDVTLWVSVVDLTGVKAGIDSEQRYDGIEISFYAARGELGEADERGVLAPRAVYEQPLRARLLRANGDEVIVMEMDAPNSPESTPRRHVYRFSSNARVFPGDQFVVDALSGWTDEVVVFTVPPRGNGIGATSGLGYFAVAFLVFAGLLSLVFGVPRRRQPAT